MKKSLECLVIVALVGTIVSNAYAQSEQQPWMGFSHKIGRLWTQVTNWGVCGDVNYEEPNFEWPGGSGNIYGWKASLWIGGIADSLGYVSAGESNHFRPLDTIHVKHPAEGARSAEDTYTRYTDVDPPSPSSEHRNLGVEVTERTYAWDQSYSSDLIICDYWIKYVPCDRNENGKIDDSEKELKGVYVAVRMDADVSRFQGAETPITLWHMDDMAGYDDANKLIYLYDGDSPSVDGDDTGNPDPVTGILRSPGYIGVRLLHADSAHFVGKYTGKPTMAATTYRNFEPTTSTAQYEFLATAGTPLNPSIAGDYRIIIGVGPFTITGGDSIHVVIAWVIGNGLSGITENSQTAQTLFDRNYVSITSVDGARYVAAEPRLDQSYPNPFNPSTTIGFSLPKTANVSLRIFNTLGQEVAELVNGRREAGHHQVTWNANVPSGIYFYRLQARQTNGGQAGDASTSSARGFVETKKMLLVR